jgi:hypothetical protein
MRLAAETHGRLRTNRVRGELGRRGTWQVVGHPFRVVALPAGWIVVPASDHGRRLLLRHDLLARPFSSRAAALRALNAALLSGPRADRRDPLTPLTAG